MEVPETVVEEEKVVLHGKRYCNVPESENKAYYILKETNWYGDSGYLPSRCLALLVIDEKEQKPIEIKLCWENYKEKDSKYFPDFYWGDYYQPKQVKPSEIEDMMKRKIEMQDKTGQKWKIVKFLPVNEIVKNFINNIFGEEKNE